MASRTFRKVGITATALAAALTLAACSTGTTTSSGGNSIVDSTAKAPTGVTLTLWHSTADTPALLKLYKAYEKESGNTIKLVAIPADQFGFVIQSKWATGARPDLLEWQGNNADVASLNMPKNALALTSLPFVKKEGALAKVSGYDNGQTYAATLGPVLTYGMYYNKAIFTAAGLTPPKDYADIAKDCTVLKAKNPGVAPLFEAGGSSFPPQALAAFNYMGQYNKAGVYGNAVAKGTKKLDATDSPFLKALTAYDNLRRQGCFNSDASTATWAQQTQALLNGKTAMIAEDSNSIAQMTSQDGNSASDVGSKIGWVPVSATKAVANTSPNPIGTYYVPKTGNTKQELAAVDFVKYATSSKAYQTYVDDSGSIPTLSGTKTPTLEGLWKDISENSSDPGLTLNSSIPGFGNQFGNESDKLLAGQETPAQLASKMQAYVEQAVAAEGK